MNNPTVALIAFEDFENLGIGYLASVLTEEGFEPIIIDFRLGKKEILKRLDKLKPLITGFSLVFQYHIYEFKKLIDYLRKGGIKCHFTAGGYYASLRFEELFGFIPWLDTIVRFDGEYTLLELTKCLNSGTDWRKVSGIAFRNKGEIISNPLRYPETDLDKFPLPKRSPLDNYAFDKRFATLLAGRGCSNNCSFCNNREYNKQSSGPIKRIRNPEKVAEEMKFLYQQMDCSVFLFQDDDFPAKHRKGSVWVDTFCKELTRKKLKDKIMWKINCRPDEIEYDSFANMKRHGLFLVFLGIDDGTESGLVRLNKQMSVAKSLEGVNILKQLEIGFDYGFMLFQPSTTFISVKENLDFLRQICGDGYTPVTYLKLRPYFETRIEKELREEGRLKGKSGFFDYDFIEESMNHYFVFTQDCFMEWLTDPDGLVNMSKWAINYIAVISFYYQMTPDVAIKSNDVRKTISESNMFFLDTMRDLGVLFESGKYNDGNYRELKDYKEKIKSMHDHYTRQIDAFIRKLFLVVEYQELNQLIKY
ncbi:MAG TPA: radical SAM protein [Bacteroidales bacterium]|nr:radical SAM protein [Bacteroidales bacterium]